MQHRWSERMPGAGPDKGPTVLHLSDVGSCTRQRLQTPNARAVLPHVTNGHSNGVDHHQKASGCHEPWGRTVCTALLFSPGRLAFEVWRCGCKHRPPLGLRASNMVADHTMASCRLEAVKFGACSTKASDCTTSLRVMCLSIEGKMDTTKPVQLISRGC
jgi:hypothetical protein